MPQNLENLPPNWDAIDEECQHVPLTCPWTITCEDGTLSFIITSLDWTFNYDFWIRVTAHPEENPIISKQLNIDKHHPLLESLSRALNDYMKVPEPHLNSLQIHILGELLDFSFWEDIPSKIANAHLAYPELALDKFSGTDADQDAEAFIRLIECKINFALGTEPDEADAEHVIYLFRKKALFSSLLRGPAAEWYGSTITDAMTWNDVRTLFITRVSDGWNKFRHRLEVEHCIRADGEEIRNFLHRIKKTVDRGWLDDMVGIAVGDQNAERTAQARQRKQRYIDYTPKGLRPRYLQRKAQKYLMEHPNITWNDFSTHLINKDVSYQVSTSFLNDEEQNKAQMASLGQELKNLRTELKEHRVNTVEGNQKPIDPNQKGRQNATRFCGYCRTNGHTPNYCRKKIRDEEIKKLQNEATAEKKVTFTQDYNKRRGPSHGSGNWTRRNDDDGAMMSTPRPFNRGSFRPNNPNSNNFRQNRPFERGNHTNDNNIRYNEYRARSTYQPNQDQSRDWRSNNDYSRSPSTSRQESSFTDFRNQPRSNSPNPSVFNRFGNRDPGNNIPYDKKCPTSNNGNQPNVVRFTTTDDEISALSGLCPLNYWGLRAQLLASPKIQDSASSSSTSPPETLKKIVA